MPESLSFGLNFVHPLLEWSLLGLGGWVLYLGIKAKKFALVLLSSAKRWFPGSSRNVTTSGPVCFWPSW